MVLFTTLVAFVAFVMFAPAAVAKGSDKDGVRGHITIKAPARIVWEAVHKERATDPDLSYSKVVEKQGDKVMLEQKFNGMPVIGEAVCLLEQTEAINQRIDYKLVRSDKFKDLRGSWILTELPEGSTKLELHSVLNTGLPFSEHIINHVLKGRINKRLERVKVSAERILEAELKENTPALAGKQQSGLE
jgi:ribosome-associated toxin RatA of RatAB toxin-antitoxin module